MTEQKMDAVDEKQQQEIDAIKKVNEKQDRGIMLLAIAIVGWLMLVTTIMMVRLTQWPYPPPTPSAEEAAAVITRP